MSEGSEMFRALPTAAKRRELAAYRALELTRAHKSRAGRRRVEEGRIYRFVGNGSADQPFLKVTKSEYFQVWEECADILRQELVELGLDPESAFVLQGEKHERMVYARLAENILRLTRTEAEFERLHGRSMTQHERELFARQRGRQVEAGLGKREDAGDEGRRIRQVHVARVLGSIGSVTRHRPAYFQEVWSALVGPAIAAEVILERVDPAKGVAYCRCLNATRAYDLRRRRSLPGKLADALGLRIERILFG